MFDVALSGPNELRITSPSGDCYTINTVQSRLHTCPAMVRGLKMTAVEYRAWLVGIYRPI